jgi:hypothetical protein
MIIPVKFSYREYKVSPPDFLSRADYETIKIRLALNPKEKIFSKKPEIPFKEFIITEALFIFIFLLFFLAGFILQHVNNLIISFFGVCLMIFGIISGSAGFIFSFFSFITACLLPLEYNHRRRKFIIKSVGYENFKKLFLATHNAHLSLAGKEKIPENILEA